MGRMQHLSPRTFHAAIVRDRERRQRQIHDHTATATTSGTAAKVTGVQKEEREVVVLDVRNLYESAVGRFEGAVCCPTVRRT